MCRGSGNGWDTNPLPSLGIESGYGEGLEHSEVGLENGYGEGLEHSEVGLENGYGDGWGLSEVGGLDNDSYEPEGWGSSTFSAGDSPYQIDQYSDGYQENVFQVNWGDSPYRETADNPDPDLEL